METKNAKQHVQDVTEQLTKAKSCLNKALNSVEKPENKQKIQNTLNSVDTAFNDATSTLSNYTE